MYFLCIEHDTSIVLVIISLPFLGARSCPLVGTAAQRPVAKPVKLRRGRFAYEPLGPQCLLYVFGCRSFTPENVRLDLRQIQMPSVTNLPEHRTRWLRFLVQHVHTLEPRRDVFLGTRYAAIVQEQEDKHRIHGPGFIIRLVGQPFVFAPRRVRSLHRVRIVLKFLSLPARCCRV